MPITKRAREIFRDYVIDGMPSSGAHQPIKLDVRQWGLELENATNLAAEIPAGYLYATLTALNAVTNYPVGTQAWVYADSTLTNNGVYRRSVNSVGTGYWERVFDLPYSIISVSINGSTPNVLTGTSSRPLPSTPYSALLIVSPIYTNTGPVSLNVNSAGARPVYGQDSSELQAGYLKVGSIIALLDAGSHFRTLNDFRIEAFASTASAAAITATAAANTATANSTTAVTSAATAIAAAQASGNIKFYDTKAQANAALASLPEDQVIEVFKDESRDNARTRYRKQSGVYVYKLTLYNINEVNPIALNKLYLIGDSWTYLGSTTGLGYYAQALQNLLGTGRWRVVNRGIGGTTIGPAVSGGQPDMLTRFPTEIARYKDARVVGLQGGINDIALGRTASEIILSIESMRALCVSIGANYYICNIGPFKGASFWNSTTQGYVDQVNAYIAANFAHYVDLFALFNDPTNPNTFKPNYAADPFHPNQAGYELMANAVFSAVPFENFVGDRMIGVTKDVIIDQDLTITSTPTFKKMSLGRDPSTFDATLNTRPGDGLVDGLFNHFMAQYNSIDSGWGYKSTVAGDLEFSKVETGNLRTPKFRLSQSGYSIHNGKLQIASDTVGLRVSNGSFVSGIGTALDIVPRLLNDGLDGIGMYVYASGGAAFGYYHYDGAGHIFKIGGVEKFRIGAAGKLTISYMPAYPNQTAAIAGGLTAGDIYSLTTAPYNLCMVR